MNAKRKALKTAAFIAAFTLTAALPVLMQRMGILSGTLKAYADEEKPEEGNAGPLKYQKYSDHVVISQCDQSVTSVEIPETIDGKPVTEIGMYAFQMTKLTSVEIPNSVKIIGNYSFSMCLTLS